MAQMEATLGNSMVCFHGQVPGKRPGGHVKSKPISPSCRMLFSPTTCPGVRCQSHTPLLTESSRIPVQLARTRLAGHISSSRPSPCSPGPGAALAHPGLHTLSLHSGRPFSTGAADPAAPPGDASGTQPSSTSSHTQAAVADAARQPPSDDSVLPASDSHPAFRPLPQVEQYMRLRAADHHALPDDEQHLLAALVQRAHEVEEHRIGVQPHQQPAPAWAFGLRARRL